MINEPQSNHVEGTKNRLDDKRKKKRIMKLCVIIFLIQLAYGGLYWAFKGQGIIKTNSLSWDYIINTLRHEQLKNHIFDWVHWGYLLLMIWITVLFDQEFFLEYSTKLFKRRVFASWGIAAIYTVISIIVLGSQWVKLHYDPETTDITVLKDIIVLSSSTIASFVCYRRENVPYTKWILRINVVMWVLIIRLALVTTAILAVIFSILPVGM